MREIKFRAWDKVIKSIVKIISLDYECDVAKITKGKDIVEAKLKELELMQYTGLKDKNGVEIYEGDVVKDIDDEYDNSNWKERFQVVKFEEGSFLPVSERHFSNFEVVGNIYEATPEQKKEWGLQ